MQTYLGFCMTFFLLYSFEIGAQERSKDELRISFGINAREYEAINMIQNLPSILTFQDFLLPLDGSNVLFAEYKHHLNQRFAAGVSVGAASNRRDDSYGRARGTFILGLSFQVNYFSRPKLLIYGRVGTAGILTNRIVNTTERHRRITPVALHLAPVGIRYGKSFGFFAEGGYGYQGILNIGVSQRF